MNRQRRRTAAVIAVAAAMTAASLGVPAISAASSRPLPTLDLRLTPKAVTVGGAQVSGAVNVVATVSGERSDSPTLVRLNDGVTPAMFARGVGALQNGPLDGLDALGSAVFDGNAVAGRATSAQTVLFPGTYVALESGSGHAVFTVTASAHPAPLPTPSATVTAIDFGFRGASTLRDGELVRFQNAGYLLHMGIYAGVSSAAQAATVEKLLIAGHMKQARAHLHGPQGQFFGPLSHGGLQQEIIDQPPGYYILACFMDTEDGRDHTQLGMVRTLHVVR